MGEVSDHRDDLIEAGLAKGLSAEVAQRVAERKLGNPLELAERVVTAHRKSTWFGRHFLLTFGFLPLVAFPLLWALFLALGLWLEIGVGFGVGGSFIVEMFVALFALGEQRVRVTGWSGSLGVESK